MNLPEGRTINAAQCLGWQAFCAAARAMAASNDNVPVVTTSNAREDARDAQRNN